MGVYTSPGVLSYVVKGSKLDTNVSLGLGTHAVEVKEWDNCGGSSGSTVAVTIQGNVSVTSPSANSTVSSPVHFVASAGSSCSKGVASIGIYTAPFQRAYLTDGSKLDTQLSLSPGTYNTVIQSWDKCGGTSTKPVTITVSNSSGGGNVSTGGSGRQLKSPFLRRTARFHRRFTMSPAPVLVAPRAWRRWEFM